MINDDAPSPMLATFPATTYRVRSPLVTPLTPEWPVNDLEAFRTALLEWLRRSWHPTMTVREWWAKLAAAGLTMPTWPRSYGGISAPTIVQELIESVFAATGVVGPPVRGVGLRQVGPALRQHARPDQCERLLRPMMRGLEAWGVLIHEPGRELPDVQTGAASDGGTFTINGDKSSTPDVDGAERAVVLAVTAAERHINRRMTCFAVALDHPGVEIVQLEGARFVRLRDVAVDYRDVIGDIGGGWAVAQTIGAHARTTLAARIRRGVVDVAPGRAAGNLDRVVGEVVATHRARPVRGERRDEPWSDRRHSSAFT